MRLIAAVLFSLVNITAYAVDLNLVAIMGDKVMIEVDGGRPKMLAPGQNYNEVKFVSLANGTAVFDVGGQKKTLSMDNRSFKSSGSGNGNSKDESQTITLYAERGGHFYADISINGITARGVIDTGATGLALPKAFANTAGIDRSSGARTYSRTANGVVPITVTSVNTLKFADVVLHNVPASVHEGNGLDVVLIGNSILSRFKMERDGDKLILTKRY